jgi:hypothetical protein
MWIIIIVNKPFLAKDVAFSIDCTYNFYILYITICLQKHNYIVQTYVRTDGGIYSKL